MLTRREFVLFVPVGFTIAASAAAASEPRLSVRGKLVPGKPAFLETTDGKRVELTGDAATLGVLADSRLADADFEANGESAGAGKMKVDPIHTRAMFVHKDGRKFMISYWCEVCSIRTYSPGVCACCQDETALDLKEKFE